MKLKKSDFVNLYVEWLKSKIQLKEIGDYIEISTPFLDRHNDHLQIYAKQEGDKILLTDDGYTISDLLMSGCDLNSPRRRIVLQTMLNGLGVKIDGEELVVEARVENFPQKKHALIQAMLSVNDMFMLSQSRVASLFLEDVENYLDVNDIRYTSSVQFFGKSGFSHTFDFVIPSSKQKPERLIRALNNPTREKAQTIIFSWYDVRESRKKETSILVFVNNADKIIRTDVLLAFSEYDVTPIPWTERTQYVQELIS